MAKWILILSHQLLKHSYDVVISVKSQTANTRQGLLQFVNVMQLQMKNRLLDDTTFLVADQTEVRAVWLPQIWLKEGRLFALS